MIIIRLKDFVQSSGSNPEGSKVFNALNDAYLKTGSVLLKVDSDMPLNSSFLNSSIGFFIEKYGIDGFRKTVKFQGSKTQYERLTSYISRFLANSKSGI